MKRLLLSICAIRRISGALASAGARESRTQEAMRPKRAVSGPMTPRWRLPRRQRM